MKRKIIGLIIIVLLCGSSVVIVNEDVDVGATPGGGGEGGDNNSMVLDYNYIWEQLRDLCNVTYKYPPGLIPKGRSFGSWGGAHTVTDILIPQMNVTISLDDVHTEKIQHINYPVEIKKNYTSIIDVNDFQLTVNNDNYLYPDHHVPKKESFAIASGYPHKPWICGGSLTHNYSFSNVEIKVPLLTDLWPFGGTLTNFSLNITSYTRLNNNTGFIIGNLTYIASNESVPDSNDQLGRVFLFDDTAECSNKLDNLTIAEGCILVDQGTRNVSNATASKCPCPMVRISNSDGNEIKELMENYSTILVDNVTGNLTLTYNIGEGHFPDSDYMLLYKISNESLLYNRGWFWFCYWNLTKILWCINQFAEPFGLPVCKGIVFYYTYEHHFMYCAALDWANNAKKPHPGLPMFTLNYTVGSFLDDNHCSTTLTGYCNQEFLEETPDKVGAEAYNVIGNISIKHSPGNAIAIISNRYDGWWGQTPGDSGVGGAIVLGIAKYFKDHNIKPKYNLTFLFTTGEEYGFRGAYHYNDSHPNDNIKYWFILDQLAFDQKDAPLCLYYKNSTQGAIIDTIFKEQTRYKDRTGYENLTFNKGGTTTSEQGVASSRKNCDSFCIVKDMNSTWARWHCTGMNYTEGDSLKYIDRNDLNVSAELAWSIIKYFLVNPDCWFNNVTYTAFDSPNDGDALLDSIRANFTIHSVLPNDKVRVEMDLDFQAGGMGGTLPDAWDTEYIVTAGSMNVSHTFTIPDDVSDGYYSVSFKVYNSTGCINRIIYGGLGNYYNDTSGNSGWQHLYHPLGYTKAGGAYQCVHDNISGSIFTANEDGRANNITAYINQCLNNPGPYKCMLYRANDSTLIGTTTENWVSLPQGIPVSSSWWAVFNFTGTKPLLVKGVQYVITCWGDSAYSRLYYDQSGDQTTGAYDAHVYGNPPNPASFTPEPRYYSIYCSYTTDTTLPTIANVTANPHTVGFGFNVTISADVTDSGSGVNLVKVCIAYPGGRTGNSTMTHISGNTYQYVFNNTWNVGQYNYTIWAIDNSDNSNSSTGRHFHVSATASISVATLKDTYGENEYINITDPPNPSEDYYLVGRGLTWDKYYNVVTGQNVLEISAGPINYQDDNGTWMPINGTFSQLTAIHPVYSYGYRIGNDRGLYNAYFKPNIQNDWPVAFAYNKSSNPNIYVIRSKLVGVGYLDPTNNWACKYLQHVQGSQGQINGNSATYEDVFTGTDATWSYGNTELKEAITMSNTTKLLLQNHPPSEYGLNNDNSYLIFITKLDRQNLNMYDSLGMLDGNVTVSDGQIDFKDALGNFKCALPVGDAYEFNNESVRQKLTYRIIQYNGNSYFLSGLKVSDLNAMTFPVVIDPTLTVYSSSSDGHITNNSKQYATVRNATSGGVSSSGSSFCIGQQYSPFLANPYVIWRGFVFFNTSAITSNCVITNATLSLYKNSDFSSTDFNIVVQNGQPTYPHNPMQSGDYNRNHYSGNGGSLNTVNFHDGYNNISLTNYSWINKNGMTKLCLRSSRDINGNTPTGNEYVSVYANEGESGKQPKLRIEYRNQSKIKNTGSTNISGYLLMQVQYREGEEWVVDHDTVNETTPRTINAGQQLGMDTIFNGLVNTIDLNHGNGRYRVYAAFRDKYGNILQTSEGKSLAAWWEFDVNI